MSTATSGATFATSAAAATPFSSGIWMSITRTAGRSVTAA